MKSRLMRCKRNRPANEINSVLVIPPLMHENAEQMQNKGIIRGLAENPFINPRRLVKSPLFVMLDRQIQVRFHRLTNLFGVRFQRHGV